MKIAFFTLGCKVNQYETQVLKTLFSAEGYEVVPHTAQADVYVVNSCTVTATSDKKTRQAVRRFKRQAPGAKVALTGCLPQAFPAIAAELPEADILTGARDREGLVSAVAYCLKTGERVESITPHTPGEQFELMPVAAGGDKTRAFLKIQDGCDRYCSYCIIPTARGPVRSKPLDVLREELAAIMAEGYKEVVLAGINLSLYGCGEGTGLADAVELACGMDSSLRVRLGSVEPELLSERDIRRMAQHENLCPHFHLVLQSGCDATLARMNRHYTTKDYAAIAGLFRDNFKNAAITTDVIAGFPGETDDEFANTLNFINSMGFARMHIFPFSPRSGTAAAGMPPELQVPAEVRDARVRELLAAADHMQQQFFAAQVGKEVPVLIETAKNDGLHGYSPNYTPVCVPSGDPALCGQVRRVKITGSTPAGCVGTFVC